ncbi:MAG TPA: hypothetical protein VLV48_03165 [Thermoanaerobaculia bacterium]|nr:hypothetical protein [Thermoanaerobaculia bacterium]
MAPLSRRLLLIWLVATILGVGTHLALRPVAGRDVAYGIGFFVYAAAAWPGFRLLARHNGHALPPLLYFLAFGIASILLAI